MVHGLGGRGMKSWSTAATEQSPESTWLHKLLLAEQKDARVLLFSYESLYGYAGDILSPDRLEDVARGLLSAYRDMSLEGPTPIAFIAHDIGGIIVKKVCCRQIPLLRPHKIDTNLVSPES